DREGAEADGGGLAATDRLSRLVEGQGDPRDNRRSQCKPAGLPHDIADNHPDPPIANDPGNECRSLQHGISLEKANGVNVALPPHAAGDRVILALGSGGRAAPIPEKFSSDSVKTGQVLGGAPRVPFEGRPTRPP